jgi:hypothetical protein
MLAQSCLFSFMNSQSISSVWNVHNYPQSNLFEKLLLNDESRSKSLIKFSWSGRWEP